MCHSKPILAARIFFLISLFSVVPVFPEDIPEPAEKQVVLETALGLIALEVFPEAAPLFVENFLKAVREGTYVGTIFHRPVTMALIQGGDPFTADPDRRSEFGMGGLMQLEVETNGISHKRGTVAVVSLPNEPESAGLQFFICVTDQPQLDGSFAVFGRVVEGISVVEKISAVPVDPNGIAIDRIEILKTYEREPPPPVKLPFEGSPPEAMAEYEAVVRTTLGDFVIRFFPGEAPENVRQFLRFAQLGFYDGTLFHRVVPGFVIQGGALYTRSEPLTPEDADLLVPVKGEFSDRKHVRGTVSLARGDDPDSGLDSFFVTLEAQESLDGNYTIFGEVIQGIDTVDGISQAPVMGEKPISDIRIDEIVVRRIE